MFPHALCILPLANCTHSYLAADMTKRKSSGPHETSGIERPARDRGQEDNATPVEGGNIRNFFA